MGNGFQRCQRAKDQREIEVNTGLGDTPEAINEDPYGEGWMVKVKLSDASETEGLLDRDAYVGSL